MRSRHWSTHHSEQKVRLPLGTSRLHQRHRARPAAPFGSPAGSALPPRMSRNRFEDNRGSAAYGLLLKEIADARLDRNVFSNNATGLFADGAARLVATHNVFLNNGWALKLEAKPKYVVSKKRRDFPWVNTHHVGADLAREIKALKKATPRGVLVGSPKLSAALQRLDLIDEYRFVVHPVIAGHGPYLFPGLRPSRQLELLDVKKLKSGVMALHYRR